MHMVILSIILNNIFKLTLSRACFNSTKAIKAFFRLSICFSSIIIKLSIASLVPRKLLIKNILNFICAYQTHSKYYYVLSEINLNRIFTIVVITLFYLIVKQIIKLRPETP
jgi:hypothetical protein